MYGETSVLRGAGMVPHPISHSTQGSVDFFFFSHLVFLFKGRPISRSRPLGARWSYGRLASRCIGSGGGRRVCVHRTNISERAGHNRIHPVMHDICNNVGWGLSIAKCCSSLLSRPPLFLVVFTNRSWVCGCFFFLREVNLSTVFPSVSHCNSRATCGALQHAATAAAPANELPLPICIETEEAWKRDHISNARDARPAPEHPRLAAVANCPFGWRLLSDCKL